MENGSGPASARSSGTAGEVFTAFLKLGLTSFGGPIAHLGYFHRELIAKRRWMDDDRYAQLVALCQLLPGPASSQLGFALGLIRAGWGGALAAFAAFTLPSALLLFGFATLLPVLAGPYGQAVLHGLKLVAVAVVAHGVFTMAKQLTPDIPRALLALAAAVVVIVASSVHTQLLVVAAGALFGAVFLRRAPGIAAVTFQLHYGMKSGLILLLAFALLLLASFVLLDSGSSTVSMGAAFYRSGALVFGGGHVVLPLLEQAVVEPGWVSNEEFLAGYGAAQAVPGPLFSVAAFLGERLEGGQGGLPGATIALLAIFMPGMLLIASCLPMWTTFAQHARAVSAIRGVNAAVVGLLAAALYDPLWTSAIDSARDVAIVLVAFVLLATTRVPMLAVLVAVVAVTTVIRNVPLS
jgi:chromate transporter